MWCVFANENLKITLSADKVAGYKSSRSRFYVSVFRRLLDFIHEASPDQEDKNKFTVTTSFDSFDQKTMSSFLKSISL